MPLILATLLYPINDITTTPDKPPVYVEIGKLDANKSRDLTYQDDLRERQLKLYPDLKPSRMSLSADQLLKKALALAQKQRGWKIVYVDDSNFRIEAVATTPVLQFNDDVVMEIRPESGGASFHMRSKSRVGRSDLGANYKRIKAFLNLIQQN